jgi:outer membrane protein assembly factor BamD
MPNTRPALVLVMAVLLALMTSGCSEKLSRQTGLSDADLLARGQQKAAQKKYGEAAEAFQLLTERFPTSPLAPQAQFGLAVNRMANKDNIEAEVAFDDFLRLYPADPKVPEAFLLKGRLLARQVLAPGRDQTKTVDAINAYRQFLEKAPGAPQAPEARTRIAELRNRLALHEEAVVSHFLKRSLYESAEVRARRALASYPDVKAVPELRALLARALEKEGKAAEAARVRRGATDPVPGTGGGKP